MSETECQKLINGKAWSGNGTMEGKWFAESYENAVKWGQQMGHGGENFRVVQVTVPDDMAAKMHYNPKLDNIGPARYAEIQDLNHSKTKVTWSKTISGKCGC